MCGFCGYLVQKIMPKKKPDPSPYTAEGRLKAAKEANKRQRELNRRLNVPTHILRVIDAAGSVSRIKVHKEDTLEQLHSHLVSLSNDGELESGTFVIGLNNERTDSDFRSNSQLIIGKALSKKGTKIYIHKLTEMEREDLSLTPTSRQNR